MLQVTALRPGGEANNLNLDVVANLAGSMAFSRRTPYAACALLHNLGISDASAICLPHRLSVIQFVARKK
jgi:hypothetical protein